MKILIDQGTPVANRRTKPCTGQAAPGVVQIANLLMHPAGEGYTLFRLSLQ